MAFSSGHRARCFFDGLSLAAYVRSLDSQTAVAMHDVTVLTSAGKEFVPGVESGTFNAAGPFDTVGGSAKANSGAKTVNTALSTPSIVSYFPHGTAVDSGVLFSSNLTQFDVTTGTDAPVDWSLAAQLTGQIDVNGQFLETATVTTDTDGSDVDDGASSANGAVFHLHVTAFSGFSANAITIEGSATGAFAGEESTIATFTTITTALVALGAGFSRQEVTGTIPRYLRAVDNVTGTGSCTRTITYARRN